MQDDKKQRIRKIIDRETEERMKHLLSNDLLFSHMPTLERIKPKPQSTQYLTTNISMFLKCDYQLRNNQPACFSQDLRTIRKQRWKSSEEILALPTDIGQKDQTDNSQSLDYKAFEKKNR